MSDNLEIHSTASSDISESLRNQILGKAYSRRKPRKPSTISTQSHEPLYESYELVPTKGSSFEVLTTPTVDQKSTGDNISLSYHTASQEAVSQNPGRERTDNYPEKASMKAPGDKRYITIETQTVAVQTVATGTDTQFDSYREDDACQCPECTCRSKFTTPEETDISNHTESSSQTVDIKRRNFCTCRQRTPWDEDLSGTDQFSDSDDSYTTDFYDLPYQNNEEYLKLLQELEKKLISRNRERVRRTMMEFERRSRQNQNLDKPVSDYSDDGASMLRKLSCRPDKHGKSLCYKCGRHKKRVNSDILQNEKKWDEMNVMQSVMESGDSRSRVERSLHKSHWQLDPRSGEWIKVSSFQHTDFAGPPAVPDYVKEDHKKPPPGGVCKKDCRCRHKKRHL